MPNNYFPELRSKAVFAPEGPRPQFLTDTPQFKALVAGLEAGQQIPVHPAEAALYYFLEGEGLITVDDETFDVKPGAAVIAPSGAKRSIIAKTRVIFLGVKGAQ
ncbi:MAG: cupin domain-containing protein [Anaerolineales bacterium]|nr:cupin domain-containing protein [Anaerolineales bacterium]MCL4260992.1 cupin domain-containing protein [Anaerolineales bacterium]